MLSNLYVYLSGWGWNPTTREGWLVTLMCLVTLLVASLVVSRTVRLLIAVGVIAALVSMGLLSGTVPG